MVRRSKGPFALPNIVVHARALWEKVVVSEEILAGMEITVVLRLHAMTLPLARIPPGDQRERERALLFEYEDDLLIGGFTKLLDLYARHC